MLSQIKTEGKVIRSINRNKQNKMQKEHTNVKTHQQMTQIRTTG